MFESALFGQSFLPFVLISALWRNKFLALTVFLLCLGATVGAILLMSQRYGSEAKIYVRFGRESMTPDASATGNHNVQIQEPRENEINSVYELLKSHVILEGIVDHFTPERLLETENLPSIVNRNDPLARLKIFSVYSMRDKAMEYVSQFLDIQQIKKSNTIIISYLAKDPDLAQQVVTHVIKLCQENHVKSNHNEGTYQFFLKEVETTKKLLHEAETDMRDFKNSHGLANLGSQREIIIRRIGELENDELSSKANLAAIENQLQAQAAVAKFGTDGCHQLHNRLAQ